METPLKEIENKLKQNTGDDYKKSKQYQDFVRKAEELTKLARKPIETEEEYKKLLEKVARERRVDDWIPDEKGLKLMQTLGLTKEEMFIVRVYTGESYEAMNKLLRGTAGFSENVAELDRVARAVLERALANYRGNVKRQIHSGDFGDLKQKFLSDHTTPGTIVKWNAFTSTTREGGEDFCKACDVRFEIRGAKGFYIDDISNYPGEEEVLMNSGMLYRVVSCEKRNGVYHIVLEVVDDAGGKEVKQW